MHRGSHLSCDSHAGRSYQTVPPTTGEDLHNIIACSYWSGSIFPIKGHSPVSCHINVKILSIFFLNFPTQSNNFSALFLPGPQSAMEINIPLGDNLIPPWVGVTLGIRQDEAGKICKALTSLRTTVCASLLMPASAPTTPSPRAGATMIAFLFYWRHFAHAISLAA